MSLINTSRAFESLLEPLLPAAYATALQMTRRREEAEDLVQEAALLAFRHFASFKEGTNFRAWFLRIQTNCFLSKMRQRKRRGPHVSLEDTPELFLQDRLGEMNPSRTDPAEVVIAHLDAQQVADAMGRLPEEYWIVATLYFVQDLDYQGIADVLDLPIGTVRSRLHRGRRMLQRALWDMAVEHGIVAGARPERSER
jgi:RNA polymerase sigma-70 factor (ECF subfamily)